MAGVARTTLGRYLNRFTEKRLLQSQSAFNLTESRREGARKQCYNLQHSLYTQLNSENNPVKGSFFVFFSAQPRTMRRELNKTKFQTLICASGYLGQLFLCVFLASGPLFTCRLSTSRDDRFHRALLLVLLMNDVSLIRSHFSH